MNNNVINLEDALAYRRGEECARSHLNAGFTIKELRNAQLGKNHSEAFCNGYYDELAFRDVKIKDKIS